MARESGGADSQRRLDQPGPGQDPARRSGPICSLTWPSTSRQGRPLRRGNFRQIAPWTKVVADLGLANLHFHDLRHAGDIWASKAGMSTKDLMARMGHDEMRAALVYQWATSDARRKIADKLSELVDPHRQGEVRATDDE